MTPADPFSLASEIAPLLDGLGIRYVIGGSVAATIYGEARSTEDLDIVIEADERKIRQLVARLSSDYYVEEEDALSALRHSSSFNAIHLRSMVKVDFFVAEHRPEVRTQFERRRRRVVGETPLFFYAPEDILLRKLIWFRMGGEVSERQWRDILGILRIRREPLDDTYLDRAAASFNVTDLLARARADAASL